MKSWAWQSLVLGGLLCLGAPAWATYNLNSDATVTDSTTGLTWDQCTYGLGGNMCQYFWTFVMTGSWSDAQLVAASANVANYKGHNDWRVPNVKELSSLVTSNITTSATIDLVAFPSTPNQPVWTSTALAPNPGSAWYVDFGSGYANPHLTSSAHFIRLVRGGQPPAAFDLLAPASTAGPTSLLNDTGQTQCAATYNVLGVCDSASTGDASIHPRQDGRFGRDAQLPPKVGGGAAGFDYTRVCMNGNLEGAGNCPASPSAATNQASPTPAEWACTKDNVTQLLWSLQSGQGDWTTYAQATLPSVTNAAGRCGYSTGWRLPTRLELLNLVHNGLPVSVQLRIDTNYFPATQASPYWASEAYGPIPANAWIVDFIDGYSFANPKADPGYVRLVRSLP